MTLTLDDTTIRQALTEALTRSPDGYKRSPLDAAAHAALAHHTGDIATLMASAFAEDLAAPEFRARVTATLQETLLDALADKVRSAVRTMPAADARELAGALFPGRAS